jgi:hypothetical protein
MEEKLQLDLGDPAPATKAVADSYRNLVNIVIHTVMGLAGNDVSLAHALASSVESRCPFRKSFPRFGCS